MDAKFRYLFTPLKIGSITIKNEGTMAAEKSLEMRIIFFYGDKQRRVI